MEPTRTIWQDLGIKPGDIPDFSFILFDNSPTSKVSYKYFVDGSNRLKSKGNIQTLLDMHTLTSKSLRIISPKLVFTPDFPDYLLSEDDPKYMKAYPIINASEDLSMPHHRNDIFQRNYTEYKTIDRVPAPHVTWGVVRTEPGTFGGDPFRGTQEVKPRPREFLAIFSPDLKKYVGDTNDTFVQQFGRLTKYLQINGQAFDNLVQYNIWARSAWEAEELTEWFKDYMSTYTGMFREAGIVQMWFNSRVRDDILIQIKNKFHLRSFLYYIRTERIDINSVLPIRRIEANVHVESLPQGIGSGSDEIVVDDFHDKLLEKWHAINVYS